MSKSENVSSPAMSSAISDGEPEGDTPPVFQIDLSLPPAARYVELVRIYKPQMLEITNLFDQLLADLRFRPFLFPWIHRLARLLFRIHGSEERQELQGISEVTEVPLYLLISFNVLLDMLMGCTSGAVRSREEGQNGAESRMLHFRTLDWDMDPLRDIVVQLDFVRRASSTPKKVLATSLTYVGYVGVLTGVKPGLSISLNFRPLHNAAGFLDHVRFYGHILCVLTGLRQSISSLIRSHLLSDSATTTTSTNSEKATIDTLAKSISLQKTTACYLTLSDGSSTITIEKDLVSGKIRKSRSFIAITNHDLDDLNDNDTNAVSKPGRKPKRKKPTTLLDQIVAESSDRRGCILEKWKMKARQAQTADMLRARDSANSITSTVSSPSLHPIPEESSTTTIRRSKRLAQSQTQPSLKPTTHPPTPQQTDNDTYFNHASVSVTESEMISWMSEWPTTNECTHFSVVMDPAGGQVVWARRYRDPVQTPAEEHRRMSFQAGRRGDA